ncbi:hypothetical protein TMatcc_006184 [Talaromyces marneffei ATCC 18224]|uniref:E3 ubiquitin-protein ligase listerin n=1 Tax=Talaromyces marneffei (strain ATCC 18224 / CBS 334.59 / QM 7333) TaxID=441960 RepID=B6QC91_TALMQ|nr:RING zinc finger protein, putative [Talaromyces marneffei ATCC 18224]
MSKKFKSQASSSRAATSGLGGFTNTFGGFSSATASQATAPSSLSYVAEPPDLSRITDPNLVVAFKSLTKKDDITKTKALEDIKETVLRLGNRSEDLEEGFLEAWTKVYPRNSIENARRVRQLAHTIQGLISSLAGKRVARHLAKVVGAWLAGLYDNDRLVSRLVVESISQVFPTDEKRNGLWKIFQTSILEFVDDVILHQTVLTLSDERIVKPDDAEAKYARVSATAILLLNRILSTTSPEQIAKDRLTIQTILNSKNTWSFTHHADPFVRRSVYNLLRSSLAQDIEDLDWWIISNSIISQALPTPQLGSATEFSETLLQLSQNRPQIWTTDFSGKTDSSKRLHQYIKKGSQGATELFWTNLLDLLQTIPRDIISRYGSEGGNESSDIGISQAKALMNDLLTGLMSRDEPRHNLKTGWAAYYDIGIWLSTLIAETEKSELVTEYLTKIFDPYVNGNGEDQWILPSSIASATCNVAFLRLTNHGYEKELKEAWETVTQNVLQAVKLSLPEQSKDFRSSQDAVCTKATQYFKLEAAVLSNLPSENTKIPDMFKETTLLLLKGSLKVLQARNGKPYGAAAVVEEAIRYVPEFIKDSEEIINSLKDAITQLLPTPSADRIMSIILMCSDWEGFESVFDASLESMTEATMQDSSGSALQKLLSTVDFQKVQESSHFISIVSSNVEKAIAGNSSQWPFVFSVIENKTVPGETIDQIVMVLVHGLSSDDETIVATLSGLSSLEGQKPEALKRLRNGKEGSRLVSRLLYLTESPIDEISQKAEHLEKTMRATVSADVTSASTREILKQELHEVGPQSLSVAVLSGMAQDLLRNTEAKDLGTLLADIFPSYELWKTTLEQFLRLPIRNSTSITSPLAGAVYLVNNDSVTGRLDLDGIQRDSDGASSASRLTTYVVNILSSPDVLVSLGRKQREALFYHLPLALQLIDDDASIEGSIGLIGLSLTEDRDEALETVSEGRSMIRKWIRLDTVSEDLLTLWDQKVAELDNTSPESYRIGQAYATVKSEADPTKSSDDLMSLAREVRKYNPIRAAAELAVWGPALASSASGTRLCNELIADATGFKPGRNPSEGPRSIVLLNILAQSMREILDTIPTQRMVFLVKNLIQVLQSSSDSTSIRTEAFKALSMFLRPLSEIYGSHWMESIEALCSTWKEIGGGDAGLPVLHSSLRLFAVLRDLVKSDANDDLVDAWKDSKQDLFESLVLTLDKLDSTSAVYLPRDITADLLRRELVLVPIESLSNKNDMFSLLAVECKIIQQTAFELLHRYIPQAQEQVSFDVALSKTTVNLPDELLSLLLEAPQANLVATVSDAKTLLRIRAYLMSWKLVFDHFSSSASLPVQENYAENIKEHQILAPLLEFTFDFLQKSYGKLVDASKFDIRSWEPIDEPSERDTQWLLIHLYYLSLKHLSLFTKNWWIDSKKRIKGPVETWTQKYITPSIIEDALTGVSTWIQTQEDDDERPLTVKVSHRTAELVASIPVDEDSPPVAMAISLPPAYPLHPAIVTGRSRVLVDEKKWRSWMLIIQGVIMFSNGNLVDGLLAFRRNVQGALKGQSECAICYSVISTDMQTPNKRCATCKNAFHSVCLFRWFKSSNQSTCPLCRNNFVYI